MKKLFVIALFALLGAGLMNAQNDLATLRIKAQAGDPVAQYELALRSWNEDDIFQISYEKWMKMSAEQGYAKAQYWLAGLYTSPEYTNFDEADSLYKCAFQNFIKDPNPDAETKYLIGQCYLRGEGVKEDEMMAFAWFMLAANDGYAEAQCEVAGLIGGIDDETPLEMQKEAFRLYNLAAKGGDARAWFVLGMAYLNGSGILPVDKAKAKECFTKAYECGDRDALLLLEDTELFE